MQIPETTATVCNALLTICLFAVFADGEKSETEREVVKKIEEELGTSNVAELSRKVLMRKITLEDAVAGLASREDRLLAYEMALSVCEAGGSITADEQEFLTSLKKLLSLESSEIQVVEKEVATIVEQPLLTPPPLPAEPAVPDQSGMILKYAILSGALELLPETLATMAIVPLQIKMVHAIGQVHGVELDRAHIKEFLAVAGAGLGSQVVEGFARQLMRGFAKKMAGKLAGRAADQITGSAFSFASTYAIGHVAVKYYQGGRKLDTASLREMFTSLQTKAREIHADYLPQIQERASSLNISSIMSMISGGQSNRLSP